MWFAFWLFISSCLVFIEFLVILEVLKNPLGCLGDIFSRFFPRKMDYFPSVRSAFLGYANLQFVTKILLWTGVEIRRFVGLSMDLYIHTLTGTAFELRVSPFETIMSIKAKIQRLEGTIYLMFVLSIALELVMTPCKLISFLYEIVDV